MRSRLFAVLLVLALVSGVAAGCVGGGGQGDSGQDGAQAEKTKAEKKQKKPARETETLSGVVTRVDVETRRFVVRPEEGEPTLFIFNPKSFKVTVDGEKAEPEAIEKRQRAEVEYFTNDDKKIALSAEFLPGE